MNSKKVPISIQNKSSKFTLMKNNDKTNQIQFFLQNKHLNLNIRKELIKGTNKTRQCSKKQLLSISKEDYKASMNKTRRELNEIAPCLNCKMLKMFSLVDKSKKKTSNSSTNRTIHNKTFEKQRLKLTPNYKKVHEGTKKKLCKTKRNPTANILNYQKQRIPQDKPRLGTIKDKKNISKNNNKSRDKTINPLNQAHKDILRPNKLYEMISYRSNNYLSKRDIIPSDRLSKTKIQKNNNTIEHRVSVLPDSKNQKAEYINTTDNDYDMKEQKKQSFNDDSIYLNIHDEEESEENNDNFGVLTYSEVQDIIIYNHFDDIPKGCNHLFDSNNTYDAYIRQMKDKLIHRFFGSIKGSKNENKSPSTNDSR